MVAGLRTAAVWVVGTATLATPVGAPSLGHFIFSGLQTRNYAAVSLGCVAAAALAFALDRIIGLLQRGSPRAGAGSWRARWRRSPGSLAAGLPGAGGRGAATGAAPVVIGAKSFSEQYVLAELLAGWIDREAGAPARVLGSLGSTVLFDALRAGEIDVYVDYTGTLWATILRREGPTPDRAAVLAEVRRALAEEHGVTVAAALGFENAYALAMRAERPAPSASRPSGTWRATRRGSPSAPTTSS
jgi:osmoprotectant transport system permease protein